MCRQLSVLCKEFFEVSFGDGWLILTDYLDHLLLFFLPETVLLRFLLTPLAVLVILEFEPTLTVTVEYPEGVPLIAFP